MASDSQYIWHPDGPQFVSGAGFQVRSAHGTRAVVVHHSAGNDETRAQIDAEHKAKGWKGIGYNLLIRRDGTIYNGRGADAIGAHTGNNHHGQPSGYNSKSAGVCLTGNLSQLKPSAAQWQSLVSIVAFLCRRYGLNPLGEGVILGHRDIGNTECPGNNLYARLPELRQAVAEALGTATDAGTGAAADAADGAGEALPDQAKAALNAAWQVLYSYFDSYPPEVRTALNKLRHNPVFG